MSRATGDDDTPDEALMLAYVAGDAAAFDALHARHRGGLYRYMLRHVRDRGAADELYQDVWMSVVRVRASYVPSAKFATWLYTLAHNRVVDHWRASGRATMVSMDDDDDDAPRSEVGTLAGARTDEPETRAASGEMGARISAALAALPAEQRDAFLMQYEGGLAVTEIAAITGAGEETVKSRLRYASAKLRAVLKDLR
ncbi:MAG TPA: RNA polymerase sigma factor [Casimicrobiaceae bacterium]|jgi:RNA polymerase sigma-70 factor (ECF subfamily)